MSQQRAQFIVLDGGEGCGKSTQAQKLRTRLEEEGKKVTLVRDPGTTRIGEQIRAILLNPDHEEIDVRTEVMLFMAARAQMMKEIIQPALDEGQVVISDRFISSTIAYQTGSAGLSLGDINQIAAIAIRRRWPDLLMILDMPVEAGMARVTRAKDRIEQRPVAFHEAVRQRYLAQQITDDLPTRIINADQEVDVVSAEIWTVYDAFRNGHTSQKYPGNPDKKRRGD